MWDVSHTRLYVYFEPGIEYFRSLTYVDLRGPILVLPNLSVAIIVPHLICLVCRDLDAGWPVYSEPPTQYS